MKESVRKENKMKTQKERKSKEKYKINLKLINYFYILFKTFFPYSNPIYKY